MIVMISNGQLFLFSLLKLFKLSSLVFHWWFELHASHELYDLTYTSLKVLLLITYWQMTSSLRQSTETLVHPQR